MNPIEILLIEDNASDVRLTQEALRECRIPHRLSVVVDGQDALTFMERKEPYQDAPWPDLILLDLNIPSVDGRDLLARFKKHEQWSTIPVIALTTSTSDRDIRASYRNHVNCYIVKPKGFNAYIEMIHCIEDFWLTLARLPRSLDPHASPVRHILLVDDNPGDARLTQEAVDKSLLNTRLSVVVDGPRALRFLEVASDTGDLPELILLDLDLSGMPGLALLEFIKKESRWQHIAIVVLTNSRDPADMAACYALDVNCFVNKPSAVVPYVDLVQRVEYHWLQRVPQGKGPQAA